MEFKQWLESIVDVVELGPRYIDKMAYVYQNPSRAELAQCDQYGQVRGFLVKNKFICWKGIVHSEMFRMLKLSKDVIPIYLIHQDRNALITVTDFSNYTIWEKNPKVANKIRINSYLKSMFDNVEIHYYDEAIVGDWERL